MQPILIPSPAPALRTNQTVVELAKLCDDLRNIGKQLAGEFLECVRAAAGGVLDEYYDGLRTAEGRPPGRASEERASRKWEDAGWICVCLYRMEKNSLKWTAERATAVIPHEPLKAEVKSALDRISSALMTPAFEEFDRGYSEPDFACPRRLQRDAAYRKTLFADMLVAAEAAAKEVVVLPALADQLYVLVGSICTTDRDLAAAARVSRATTAAVIWSHGGCAYSRDGITPYVVTTEENYILEAFLIAGKPMDTRTLIEKSGATNVSRAISCLRERYGGAFRDAIRMPVKKGTGGFFVLVRDIEAAQDQTATLRVV